jgi:MFS family permease
MWNIAHNLGGFAAPLIAGGFAKSMGWKWGMWAPGIIGLVVGVLVLLVTRCAAVIDSWHGTHLQKDAITLLARPAGVSNLACMHACSSSIITKLTAWVGDQLQGSRGHTHGV